MSVFSRREFMHRSAILGAASAALGFPAARAADEPTKKGSANDRLKVAVVGVRSRGMSHVGSAEAKKESGFLDPKNNCEIVAICDCDEAVIGSAMKKIKDTQGAEPAFVKDFRKLIEDKSIDIISIATPNHWHATMAVWAMRAGKHVYCEKPATHNVHEGRLMADAMASSKKICQVGTQSRSNPGMRDAIKFLQDGKLGKVQLAYGTCYKPRKSIGKVNGPQEPPKTMDYDLWCGPAQVIQPHRKTNNGTVHYDWHWTWEYGNGDFGNQGVHEADKARWGLGAKGLPKSAVSVGGRFGYVDDGETPNTQLCLFEYDAGPLMFETRGLDTKDIMGAKVGNIWFCEKGYVVCPSYSGGVAYDKDGKEVAKFNGGGDHHHFRNFVEAVRAGDAGKLNCPAEEGHASAAICHLGNISYRMGKAGSMADAISCFDGNEKAGAAFGRMKDHIKDNKVELADAKGMIGAKITLDPKTEKITEVADGGDKAKANAMLFREYRKGFDIQKGA